MKSFLEKLCTVDVKVVIALLKEKEADYRSQAGRDFIKREELLYDSERLVEIRSIFEQEQKRKEEEFKQTHPEYFGKGTKKEEEQTNE
jgi:hypothetical protein